MGWPEKMVKYVRYRAIQSLQAGNEDRSSYDSLSQYIWHVAELHMCMTWSNWGAVPQDDEHERAS